MKVIRCTRGHSDEILAILNEAIVNSTALYDYVPRTPAVMVNWFDAKESAKYPVVGVTDDHGRLLGFGSYGAFRAWPAYKYTVEHSIYVEKSQRGRGVGKLLLEEVIKEARKNGYHNIVGGIDAQNEVSIGLHRRFNFEFCGCVRHAGFKFNRWLDLHFYQLILDTPSNPVDG